MKHSFSFWSLCLLSLLPVGACITRISALKNPCQAQVLTRDISGLSRAELEHLAKVIGSSSYGNPQKCGCQAALLGRINFALENMTQASNYFSTAAKKLPDLSHYFLLAKAQAEAKKHSFDVATKTANAILNANSLPLQFSLRARLVLADIAVTNKNHHEIIRTHQDLLDRGFKENDVLLFNLAQSLKSLGEFKKADEVYKRLLIDFPGSAGAKHAESLKTLAQYSLNIKEAIKRFDKLIERLAFDQVIRDADLLTMEKSSVSSNERRVKLQSYAIKALMLSNRFKEGLLRAKKLTKEERNSTRALEAYAWALAKAGHFVEAAKKYKKISKTALAKDERAKACFFQGFSLYEASLYPTAIFDWHGCYDDVKDSDYHENYLWYKSLSYMLSEDSEKSSFILENLIAEFPDSREREKYNYFLSHNLQKMNQRQDANALLFKIANQSKPSFYSQLARKRLGMALIEGSKLGPDALSTMAKDNGNPNYKNATLLNNLGYKQESQELIMQLSGHAKEKLAALQSQGFYHQAFRHAHQTDQRMMVVKEKLKIPPTIRASFPLPFRPIVRKVSKKYRLPESLLYAIMKTESGFLQNATSNRGAIGPMQMMPFVAEDLAMRLNIPGFDSERLKEPEVAIELGALFMATLMRQFADHHLALAAYNAGPHQVQKWLDEFGHLPTELFIERIPYKQTRKYVKQVLHTESLYHAMNGKHLRLLL